MAGSADPLRPAAARRAHEEVLDRIELAISSGRLNTGDRLPGERELAEEAHDPEGARAAVRDHILGFYRQTIGEIPG